MDKYVIIMVDGRKVLTTGVNLNAVNSLFNKNNSIAAKIGTISMAKHLVMAVVKIEALVKTDLRNVTIQVGDDYLYTSAKSEVILDSLTNDLNKNVFVIVNNEILINRNAYQYSEMDEYPSEGVTGSESNEELENAQEKELNIGEEETQADA